MSRVLGLGHRLGLLRFFVFNRFLQGLYGLRHVFWFDDALGLHRFTYQA